ncbi:glutathione S-transferase theta-1-like [Acanthaster planci]|uniref:Glutathione S-transferase theta-1-like n=1 Tax=Acanthaster planci TaxID=133434 RepID=A0A8B7XXR1_ACAPL|nr:glutathione S-transferase theta-1-like [Acanthaster planci]
MVLTVYGHQLSEPSRSVYLFCKVAKIPHTTINVDLLHEEHKQEAYLAINPLAVVPSIVDDDFKLSECMSILKYLARKYKVADHWYPEDLKVRAKVDQYLDWQHTGVRKTNIDCLMLFLGPLMGGKPIDEAEMAEKIEMFDKSLGTIEKVFLGDKKYVASDEISIADICCLSEVMQSVSLLRSRTDLLASHPKLAAWKERAVEKLNPDYDEVFKLLSEFAANPQTDLL